MKTVSSKIQFNCDYQIYDNYQFPTRLPKDEIETIIKNNTNFIELIPIGKNYIFIKIKYDNVRNRIVNTTCFSDGDLKFYKYADKMHPVRRGRLPTKEIIFTRHNAFKFNDALITFVKFNGLNLKQIIENL